MIPIWTCRRCWTPTRSLRHKNKNKHWRGWGDVILWAPAINHAKRKQLTMNSNVFSSSSKRLRKPILPLINNQKQPPTMRNIGMKGCLGQSYRCIDPIESNVFHKILQLSHTCKISWMICWLLLLTNYNHHDWNRTDNNHQKCAWNWNTRP